MLKQPHNGIIIESIGIPVEGGWNSLVTFQRHAGSHTDETVVSPTGHVFSTQEEAEDYRIGFGLRFIDQANDKSPRGANNLR